MRLQEYLTGNPTATIEDGILFLEGLIMKLHIPALAEYGIKLGDIPILVENASVASSMQANPIQLSKMELSQILEAAL